LATDVILPPGDTSVPVILLRTPYGKNAHLGEGLGWAKAGFGFIVQDVRGRYDSRGEWCPYVHERDDGAAVLAWVVEQPWCDGSIVLIGGSYASFTAWTAALSKNPAARAVISLVPAVGGHACYGPGGVLYLASHLRWWIANAHSAIRRDELFQAMYRVDPGVLATLPVRSIGHRLWADLPTWFGPVNAGPCHVPDYAVTDDELGLLDVATLHIGGWYDGFLDRTLHQWHTAGSSLPLRPPRALLVGPWTHDLQTDRTPVHGLRHHEPQARLPLGRHMVAWLRSVLGGIAPSSHSQVYVGGAERWDTGLDWPPPTSARTWYAAPGCELRPLPASAGSDGFRYDPDDPFPSRDTPLDRHDLDARPDAVRYTSPPLVDHCEITGHAEIVLHACTDGPGTDWVARLLEVTPAGQRLFLTQGLAEDSGHAPGSIRTMRIRFGPLAVRVPAGHRICLEITSSDFPDHARNLNTGQDRYTTSATRVATQIVHHGPEHPTAITLPVATS